MKIYSKLCISITNIALVRNPYIRYFFLASVFSYHVPMLSKGKGKSLGWGMKQSGLDAARAGKRSGEGCLLLEDGFIRSFGLGVEGYPPHSLVADSSGIYYDSSKKSDLEQLIIDSIQLDSGQIYRAKCAIQKIIAARISKYNHAPDIPLPASEKQYRVLVVDQTLGDASVRYGGADSNTFKQMLHAALAEHPDAEILVKVHPDVLSGRKKGYLFEVAKKLPCTLISEDINPWSLIDSVKQVYVVTSQFGFEALMGKKKVTCFGMPFYSGWGLTDDRQICRRRSVERSLEQIFYAAYIQYSRYINPYTYSRCQLEDTIRLISTQKQHKEYYNGNWHAFGFSVWKTRFLSDYLGSNSTVTFSKQLPVDKVEKLKNCVLVWSGRITNELEVYCSDSKIDLYRMEDGFIRSVGLGVDLVRPLSLVIDGMGIYYDSTQPSDLENYLNYCNFSPEILSRAAEVRRSLVDLRLSKYNVGHKKLVILPKNRHIILVPGQVETDASIAKGSPEIQSNAVLLRTVRQQNPDAFIIYKPHPDVLSGGRLGELETKAEKYFDLLVTDVAITELFDHVDEVHTMTSLAGFEALLRDIKVYTYGMPFYAGWGLTYDQLSCNRRQRHLTLDQLVAATLILYPIYVEPESGHVCDVETIIALLYKKRDEVQGPSWKTRTYRFLRKAFDSVK